MRIKENLNFEVRDFSRLVVTLCMCLDLSLDPFIVLGSHGSVRKGNVVGLLNLLNM